MTRLSGRCVANDPAHIDDQDLVSESELLSMQHRQLINGVLNEHLGVADGESLPGGPVQLHALPEPPALAPPRMRIGSRNLTGTGSVRCLAVRAYRACARL